MNSFKRFALSICMLSVMAFAIDCSSDRQQIDDGGVSADEAREQFDAGQGADNIDTDTDETIAFPPPDVDQLASCDPEAETPGASTIASCVGELPVAYPQDGFGYEVGHVIAPYRFMTYAGETIDLSDYYTPEQSGLLVLSVAFMWCPHCRAYQPYLNQWLLEYQASGVEVIVDLLQDYDREAVDEADATAYREDEGLSTTTAFSQPAGCFVNDFFGRVSAPQTVVVDRTTMKILLVEQGAGTDDAIERVGSVLGVCREPA